MISPQTSRLVNLSRSKRYGTNVVAQATAVQFMKRFYVSNSPMTYHPKEIMLSALFLSTKTENHFTKLSTFASKLPKTTPEDIIAPEFLLTQGLRFAFDVRHPSRGLSGGAMELLTMARGDEGKEIQEQMMAVSPAKNHARSMKTAKDLEWRIGESSDRAGSILKTSALLSDVYFHFTPSQIWLSAFLLADEPLAKFYIDQKLAEMADLKRKLIATLSRCCSMLEDSPSAEPGTNETKELKRIDKKLYKCRNPDKIDLVSLNQAQKRQGDEQNGLDEKTVKKRKLEREQSEKDDPFGPPLITSKKPAS